MKKKLAYLLLSAFLLSTATHAENVTRRFCTLTVSKKRYMSEPCKVTDYKFDAKIGEIHDLFFKGQRYFGYVNQNDDGTYEGLWNAPDAETHAQAPLGALRLDGPCWLNKEAKICMFPIR